MTLAPTERTLPRALNARSCPNFPIRLQRHQGGAASHHDVVRKLVPLGEGSHGADRCLPAGIVVIQLARAEKLHRAELPRRHRWAGCRRAFKSDHLCALNFDQG